jgi:hypothetical protein
MRHDATDDELLRSYLLGELPEEEAERLEQRLLAEDELFELSEAVEADLIAAYDRGELTEEERERVLWRLAASPSGRERLALARALNTLAGRGRQQVLPFRQRATQRPAFRWAALAAGLLIAASLSWFVLKPSKGGESAPWIAHERPAPAGPVQALAPAPQVPTTATIPSTAPEPVQSVFQLALVSLRGSEAAEKLKVRAGTLVELQISVEGMEDLKSFHLSVRNRNAETVWDGDVEPRTLQGARVLVIDLPADRLPPGMYKIEARGLTSGHEPEDLSPLDVEVVSDGKR